ncbi:MAG: NADH-quinone oxidoreductase subunit NuoE [Burkholderiaceae bacterium]|nr:NADH-quinone oxidoreductase subunit NuoE [Burkholderiaceae bacterium]
MSVQLSLSERPKGPVLSAAAYAQIDRELAKYPADQKQSAVMSALRIAQRETGWISPEVEADIAAYLGMPPIAVHEVASFYTMYNLKPVGRFKLTVCTNLPCALRSGNQAAEYIKAKLGIGFNETTADGLFTLKEGECMGACGDAPVMLINNHRMCSWMSNDRIDALIEELKADAAKNPAVSAGGQ